MMNTNPVPPLLAVAVILSATVRAVASYERQKAYDDLFSNWGLLVDDAGVGQRTHGKHDCAHGNGAHHSSPRCGALSRFNGFGLCFLPRLDCRLNDRLKADDNLFVVGGAYLFDFVCRAFGLFHAVPPVEPSTVAGVAS